MELKHLRKGKIQTISTEVLERELAKLEARQARYEVDIANEAHCKVLLERLIDSGESTSTYRISYDAIAEISTKIVWSDDKEEWHRLNTIIKSAKHAKEKIQKKKQLIEIELINRMLIGY